MSFVYLPRDIVLELFTKFDLSLSDLMHVGLCCKRTNQMLLEDQLLWERMYRRKFYKFAQQELKSATNGSDWKSLFSKAWRMQRRFCVLKDIFTEDEICSSAYPNTSESEFLFRVQIEKINNSLRDSFDWDMNSDYYDDSPLPAANVLPNKEWNIVQHYILVRVYPTKVEYKLWAKQYFQKLRTKIPEWSDKSFQSWATGFVTGILKHWSEYEFFRGKHDDLLKGMLIHCHPTEHCVFIFKDGVELDPY